MKIGSKRFRSAINGVARSVAFHPATPWGPDLLQPSLFLGKRVIVLGPAQTVFDDLNGTDVDAYDVVVRLNNGLLLSERDPEVLGRRTDLLLHNSREHGPRSAGAIPADLLKARRVGMLAFPYWRKNEHRQAYYAKKAELRRVDGPPLRLIPLDMMTAMRIDIGDRPPSVGATAIMFFLDAPIAEIAIHGFTFFETAYAAGYNDAVASPEDARAWVDARGTHEPTSEKQAIRTRLSRTEVAKVILGQGVRRHLFEK
ncbi:hypothetical protein JSE7799_00577 [Jannaschia seosinensis]|uniref:Glycosyltransferase family 29 (Sialyltransferase) n=1 Tax=Jannaschia seosinensis TaxID=313367 RepID=A0A0M7B9D4_9RHOB|nr:hypothetical protein [Jannaschia seosinensis]CUH21836.1 hypothetical protein JSE7799_00577 [Jannaschia seosinensis]